MLPGIWEVLINSTTKDISAFEEMKIAYRRKFIDRVQLLKLAEPLMKTEYGHYLKAVAEEDLV